MNNSYAAMSASFEARKNQQAAMITAGFTGVLLLFMFLVKWGLPPLNMTPPLTDEGIEINLGSSDLGFGDDQPKLPGEPAPAKQIAYNPPQNNQREINSAKDIEEDNHDKEAPKILKPDVSKPDAKEINKANKPVVAKTNPQPVVNPQPQRPKAVLGHTTGSNGIGGNGADSYQKGSNQGIAGGTGDQGKPGGDPNSNNYTGNVKNFGVKVLQIPSQSFEDDFNENAKVALDVEVDANGKVISATFQPKGSTTSRRDYIEKARHYAFQLKTLGNSAAGQRGTVIFDFKVRG
jgi:hypothetical protein